MSWIPRIFTGDSGKEKNKMNAVNKSRDMDDLAPRDHLFYKDMPKIPDEADADEYDFISRIEADQYYTENGLTYPTLEEKQYQDGLIRRLKKGDRVIIELGRDKIAKEIKNAKIPKSSHVLAAFLEKHYSERCIWLKEIDEEMFMIYNWQIEHPYSTDLLASQLLWRDLVNLVLTANLLDDPVVEQQACAGMRRKAKFGYHRTKHLFKDEDLVFVYAHSKPGSTLRNIMVDLAVGTKGGLRSLEGAAPAEFLEDVKAYMEKQKAEGFSPLDGLQDGWIDVKEELEEGQTIAGLEQWKAWRAEQMRLDEDDFSDFEDFWTGPSTSSMSSPRKSSKRHSWKASQADKIVVTGLRVLSLEKAANQNLASSEATFETEPFNDFARAARLDQGPQTPFSRRRFIRDGERYPMTSNSSSDSDNPWWIKNPPKPLCLD
ncbi:hypothetical protein K504DRAFT_450944 [Pleomassaria siparia CBS 279.74]|uniref:Uncharacterized protein n=1 Tax=Pleomassaria siparia CBS 279.74 TaxID=1314801 RepID=A0A6G1JV49_9PLEO|nr:hypothetical protein K504DRAFT_450944 [Pleomassaria siparia CBS 279.74]